jgi:hypothetical protein
MVDSDFVDTKNNFFDTKNDAKAPLQLRVNHEFLTQKLIFNPYATTTLDKNKASLLQRSYRLTNFLKI